MTDHDLSDLLERTADRIPVGPPPVAQLVARASARRRRRTLTVVVSSAAAVVVVMVGTVLLLPLHGSPKLSVASPTPSIVPTPPGTRLVGIGHAAIAVPLAWETNAAHCGTPQRDTVIIDIGAIGLCLVPRPEGVDSVELTAGPPQFDFAADRESAIDGVVFQRQDNACTTHGAKTLCVGTVYIPSMAASFRAESSSESAVDEILSWIRIVRDTVAVPGYQGANTQFPQGDARDRYLAAARAAGLETEITTKQVPASPAGYILDVSPQPGTMVPPGTVVRLTVIAEPEGPADEVRLSVNSQDTEGNYRDLSDAQIRAGTSIELGVGDRLWAFADGKRADTLAGTLDGTSLTVDEWPGNPNYPHSWKAVAPGTTTVTLTINVDGKALTVGTITVVVR